jgi:hypothetical protein
MTFWSASGGISLFSDYLRILNNILLSNEFFLHYYKEILMKGIARLLFIAVCLILAVLLIVHVITVIVSSIVFAIALVFFAFLSRRSGSKGTIP